MISVAQSPEINAGMLHISDCSEEHCRISYHTNTLSFSGVRLILALPGFVRHLCHSHLIAIMAFRVTTATSQDLVVFTIVKVPVLHYGPMQEQPHWQFNMESKAMGAPCQ